MVSRHSLALAPQPPNSSDGQRDLKPSRRNHNGRARRRYAERRHRGTPAQPAVDSDHINRKLKPRRPDPARFMKLEPMKARRSDVYYGAGVASGSARARRSPGRTRSPRAGCRSRGSAPAARRPRRFPPGWRSPRPAVRRTRGAASGQGGGRVGRGRVRRLSGRPGSGRPGRRGSGSGVGSVVPGDGRRGRRRRRRSPAKAMRSARLVGRGRRAGGRRWLAPRSERAGSAAVVDDRRGRRTRCDESRGGRVERHRQGGDERHGAHAVEVGVVEDRLPAEHGLQVGVRSCCRTGSRPSGRRPWRGRGRRRRGRPSRRRPRRRCSAGRGRRRRPCRDRRPASSRG